MGPVEQEIIIKLTSGVAPEVLEVLNESHMHSVPAGSESHFKVVVISPEFNGRRLVQRHQMIYSILADELAGSVHALALHTYTPDEWLEKHNETPESPNCLGGENRT
ncbi:MAG: BolA family transcriptional regulator [Porticoccaceae bacterium]|nr:BolA family transcriptional regulator [Porticoccaceae bacterium]